MQANTSSQTECRNETILEAFQDALADGDGEPRVDALTHHLAKRGLVIVEASKYGSAKAALMVIASCGALGDKAPTTALEKAAEVARVALKRLDGYQ